MSKETVFRFDHYAVRAAGEQDRAYLDNLIEADQYHRDQMDADYFLKLKPGEDAWALEDEKGSVMFYFKTQTAVRLSLQFAQAETPADKTRNRIALLKGLAWIEAQLCANSFREILFQTDGPELTAMAKRRMGFREVLGLVREVGLPPVSNQARIEHWNAVPEQSQVEGG